MTVLLDRINRYLVALDADLNTLAPSLVGSRAYSQESTSWFIWNGSTWTALTAELAAVDLDAVIAQSSGQDISDALTGAASPSASNPLATLADVNFALYVANGQDETSDTTITLTGVVTGDRVVGCIVFATKASIATITNRAASDFSVTGTDEVTVGAHAANNTNNQYLFFVVKAP